MTTLTLESLAAWFAGRLPDGWFTAAPDVTADREEVLVVGTLAEPTYPDGADEAARAATQAARIERFREETRGERMRIADDAERRTGRKVAWGAQCGETRQVFTNLSVPVMTRLRMPEREVLDTLVGAGVARSRSDALGWCVRLVRDHQGEWIQQLQDALVAVRAARASGPTPSSD
jgi:hypothetical protein